MQGVYAKHAHLIESGLLKRERVNPLMRLERIFCSLCDAPSTHVFDAFIKYQNYSVASIGSPVMCAAVAATLMINNRNTIILIIVPDMINSLLPDVKKMIAPYIDITNMEHDDYTMFKPRFKPAIWCLKCSSNMSRVFARVVIVCNVEMISQHVFYQCIAPVCQHSGTRLFICGRTLPSYVQSFAEVICLSQ